MIKKLQTYLKAEVSIAPLVVFRIAFGLLMFASVCRFILKGWVYNMYILPKVYFPFYGLEWVKPFPAEGMYLVFGLLLLSSLFITLGLFYRISITTFFLLFTYVELIDKTNYLNHYYFISLVAFILIFMPVAKNFSLDNKLFKKPEKNKVSRFYIFILQLQMFVVYFFAGVAKLNTDWLFNAQPLKTWLPAFSHFPVIGQYLELDWVAYFFCWFGCIYDLLIGFLLFNKRTVNYAYVFVVIFHLATAMFFNIGMFPFIMMTITIIFFNEQFHLSLVNFAKTSLHYNNPRVLSPVKVRPLSLFYSLFIVYFLVQFTLPFRYLLYDGKLFWTEQGYRFSWRVMLMEKAGSAFFTVTDLATGRKSIIDNKEYLTYMQEKMMATQPDMMVDYAKFLKNEYLAKGYLNPVVHAESYVTINGSGSQLFIDPKVDLSAQSNSFMKNKNWVYSH